MPLESSSIIASTINSGSLPSSSKESFLVAKGGARYPSNRIGSRAWLPSGKDDGLYVETKLYPEYEGQLFWSNTVGTSTLYNITAQTARLFVAVPLSFIPEEQRTVFSSPYVWCEVILTNADFYKDPATGKKWDPVGLYRCNPSYLCS